MPPLGKDKCFLTIIAIIYSENKVFAVGGNEEKNLHNRCEGRFYPIPSESG